MFQLTFCSKKVPQTNLRDPKQGSGSFDLSQQINIEIIQNILATAQQCGKQKGWTKY